MNEKLKAWEARLSTLIGQGRTSSGNVPLDALVFFSVSGDTDKEHRSILRVSFHKTIETLTGWQVGDVLDMEIKGENAVIFRSENGRKLSKNNKLSTRPYLRFGLPPHCLDGFPIGAGRNVEAAPGKVALLLPSLTPTA